LADWQSEFKRFRFQWVSPSLGGVRRSKNLDDLIPAFLQNLEGLGRECRLTD
jgi:hypothetical protein